MGSRLHSKGGILDRFSEKAASRGGDSPTTPKGLISAAVDGTMQPLDSMNPALSEVSHRLQRLEQQVRQQLTGKTGSPSVPGRESGRTALRDSLHALKEDVLSLAVNEVESQLLLQRLATLEKAVSLASTPGGLPHEPREAWNAPNQGK